MSGRRQPQPLETVFVEVPEAALEQYEAAFKSVCQTVAFFLADEERRIWRVEGVRTLSSDDGPLRSALLLAALTSGIEAGLQRSPIDAEGWLARTQASFPPQEIGRRFLVQGTHDAGPRRPGRISLVLDAGLAFGSGEHGSTRGCLRAIEIAARRRPRRVLDLGTGSGILAIAVASLLRRPVLAADIDPWAVRTANRNAAQNHLAHLVRATLANGWNSRTIRLGGPYDLVLANILARPLCRMAQDLALNLAPGGTAILAGLLDTQARRVFSAHRRHGLVLEHVVPEGRWTTLMLRRPA